MKRKGREARTKSTPRKPSETLCSDLLPNRRGREHGSPGQASEVQVAPDIGADAQDDPQVHLCRQGHESAEEGARAAVTKSGAWNRRLPEASPAVRTDGANSQPAGGRTQGRGLLPHKGPSPEAPRAGRIRLAGTRPDSGCPLDQRGASCPREGTTQDPPSRTPLAPPSLSPTSSLPRIRFIPCS